MKHLATDSFWERYARLPENVRKQPKLAQPPRRIQRVIGDH